MLLVIPVSFGVFQVGVIVIQGIIGASIVADLLDDHELRTGYRQEAMFNAALSFSGKAVSGAGTLLGGLIITMIAFPTNVVPPTCRRMPFCASESWLVWRFRRCMWFRSA
jgi:Na+/melibiose symporter-like transporter